MNYEADGKREYEQHGDWIVTYLENNDELIHCDTLNSHHRTLTFARGWRSK